MNLHELSPGQGAKKTKVRLGRGTSSGHGKTSGRGTKGQKAHGSVPPYFEGGQTPLHRRLPKKRGFKNRFRVEYAVVNVADLERKFEAGATITVALLVENGLVREKKRVKVLATGDISKALTIQAHAFSKTATEKLTAAGGTAEVIS